MNKYTGSTGASRKKVTDWLGINMQRGLKISRTQRETEGQLLKTIFENRDEIVNQENGLLSKNDISYICKSGYVPIWSIVTLL